MSAVGVGSVYEQWQRLNAIANDAAQPASIRYRAKELISAFAATHPQWMEEFSGNTSAAKVLQKVKQTNLKIYLALGFLLALFLFLLVWKIVLKK